MGDLKLRSDSDPVWRENYETALDAWEREIRLRQQHDATIRRLREALRGLVEALPKCPQCKQPSTIHRTTGLVCDEHKWYGCGDAVDLPYAEALRAALRELREPRKGEG